MSDHKNSNDNNSAAAKKVSQTGNLDNLTLEQELGDIRQDRSGQNFKEIQDLSQKCLMKKLLFTYLN